MTQIIGLGIYEENSKIYILSASKDNFIRRWNLKTSEMLNVINSGQILNFAVSPKGSIAY